jgi:hypothetical protein
MTRPWFRFHRAALNSPSVQNLPPETFRFWVNALCATDDFGQIPEKTRLAFLLRTSKTKAEKNLKTLVDAGLLVETENGLSPRNWDEHQYKSDVSTDRVKRFRQRSCSVTPSVSETPPETETDIRLSKNTTGSERLPWPREAVVPRAWIDAAASTRALANLAEVDLVALAATFAAHYQASDERLTGEGWRAKFIKWSIREKNHGSRTRNTTGDTIRELARMARESQGGTGGDDRRR